MDLLTAFLSYLIGLAVNERTAAVQEARHKKLRKELGKRENLLLKLSNARSLREKLKGIPVEIAQMKGRLGVTKAERPLLDLLGDEEFQADFADWIAVGNEREGQEIREKLSRRMAEALALGGVPEERVERFRKEYFDLVDRFIFSEPVLAHWRQALCLEYLRGQVDYLKKIAEEAAGKYTPERRKEALDQYCDLALKTWDIIDLSNLPEGDIQIATQRILLRQLYVPLRVNVEVSGKEEAAEAALEAMEKKRERRRLVEAGRVAGDTEASEKKESLDRAPVGKRLGEAKRLVVLADPGGGKTTMLRWMATAYILRHKKDPAYRELPDIDTLPDEDWIPVLIRCRELTDETLDGCFSDFLWQSLRKSEIEEEEAKAIHAVVMERLAAGKALVLIDGLDEIASPRVRAAFCQQIERIAARYPEAPIVVTSRIVGYRDMPYRMRSGFEHGTISDLSKEDKDGFAERWIAVTECSAPKDEKARKLRELVDALHGNDRIERLTGNPMLLTTMALVKRKVGKLPNKRHKLYREAVSVLLNWNPAIYEQIDEDEAIPQLEYIAYEMCRLGVLRLNEDAILDLLRQCREEYPNIREIRNRKPEEFLRLVEARSGILTCTGTSVEGSVYEFRALAIQEYLAARALVDGHFPRRDRSISLAQRVGALAGGVEEFVGEPIQSRYRVTHNWRDTLRLCAAMCPDDAADDLLLAILTPDRNEDTTKTCWSRANLAAECLLEEPNVSSETIRRVIHEYASLFGEEAIS